MVNVATHRRTISARSSGCRSRRIFSGDHALDVEQIADQLRDVSDLLRDHLMRAGGGLALGVRQLEHADGIGDGTERRAQLVGQHREELVFRAIVALGAVAVVRGSEELALIRHDQIQAIAS
jgi:hypothetical protein